ncbi:hypothetical protein Bca52824_088586 [Brassica carinata]|uniref:Uncharacterized protein n=1 Tax=Brassica carinata TaxID=52824 RepID=A0A8X7PE15_BRACI|nr:hypothetical protein Bca52824_088586 [Brassica carinata]
MIQSFIGRDADQKNARSLAFYYSKAPEVLESAPHRLQSSSAIPRRRSQLLTVSELHRDQPSSSCSAVIVGLQIRRRESLAVTEGRADQLRN